MSVEVPDGWKKKRLGEVSEIARGGSPRPIENFITDQENGINWIKIGDASASSKYIFKTKEKIKPEGAMKSRRVRVGDFLLSNSMSFGRPYILQTDGCIHDGWLVLSDKYGMFDREFFYYLLSSPAVFEQFERSAAGSAVKNLNKELVSNVSVALPPLPEQQRIAEILSSVDESIRATEAVIAQAERVKRGLMEDLLTGGLGSAAIANGEVPEGWRIGCFGELATVKSGFAFKSSDFCEYSQDAVAVIRMSDLKSGAVTFETAACVPLDVVNGLERFELQEGDFLFGMSGSLGNYGVVPKTSKRLFLNQRVGKLSPNKSDHRFLAHVFTSEKFVEEIYRNASGNAQANISGKQIESIEIPIPPLPEQQRIAEILSTSDEQITTNRVTVEQIKRLKRGLMDDLLTGKVRTVA